MIDATGKTTGRGRLAAAALLGLTLLSPLPAAAQQLEKVEVSAVKVSSIGSLLIAKDRGYFKDAGLDVNITLFDGIQNSVLAIASGSADIAAGSLAAAIFNLAAKGGMKIIAGQTYGGPGSPAAGLVVTNAAYDAGFKSYKDIAGKRIGINTTGGSTHYGLGIIAQKAGVPMSAITIIPLQANSNMYAAFHGGQVDGLVAGVPQPGQLEGEHAGHILTWASDLQPFELGALYANSKVLATKPDMIKRYLKAYQRGCNEYDDALTHLDKDGKQIKGPNYDAYAKLVSDTINVPVDALAGQFPTCEPSLKLDLADLGNQLDFWHSIGAVDKSIELKDVVTPMMN